MPLEPRTSGSVEYVDHMGSDISVVNAARVSFGKHKEVFDDDDERLLRYLITHEHMSPFRHVFATLRVTCPIFVERQWFTHKVGTAVNSISGRYVQYDFGYWMPEYFRKGTPTIKQGSLDEPIEQNEEALALYRETCDRAVETYHRLINEYGVCKEQARTLLGLNTMTQFIFSASLQAWFHFYRLRTDAHAQAEIQVYAREVGQIMEGLFPRTWKCLSEHGM